MAGKATKKVDKGPGILLKGYLFLYNLAQVLGWSYILFLIGEYYFIPTKHENLWESVKYALIIFQNAAVLEIIHAALRFVPSNVMITTFQVLSRVMAVCGVLIPFEESQKSIGLLLLLFAWTITEIIRYSYYAINIVGNVPYFIIWCRGSLSSSAEEGSSDELDGMDDSVRRYANSKDTSEDKMKYQPSRNGKKLPAGSGVPVMAMYTFFIVLYPIGVTGELISLYYAQDTVAYSKLWTVEMPNLLNVTFSYRYFLLFTMFLYIPLFPQMYLHMFAQRRKIIGAAPSKKAKTT